jgi:hypothetical protein
VAHSVDPDFVTRDGIPVRKIAYSPDRVVFETAPGAIQWSPEQIARFLGMGVDQGWDELDYFYILIVEIEAVEIGFLRHWGSLPAMSDVCDFSSIGAEAVVERLKQIFPGEDLGWQAYPEPW